MADSFGKLIKECRIAKGLTLREFCRDYGFDSGNYSRIERGITPPPKKLLASIAEALEIRIGSMDRVAFSDLASVARSEIPGDIMSEAEIVKKLPAMFRMIREEPMFMEFGE